MGGSASSEAEGEKGKDGDNKVHPDKDDSEVAAINSDGDASPSEVEAEGVDGDDKEKGLPKRDGENNDGGEDPSRASNRTGGTTPFTQRPRPNFPVKRFALDDERRPPRQPPVDAVVLDPWSEALFEEARMIAPFNEEELKGLYERFAYFDTTHHGFISGEERCLPTLCRTTVYFSK